SHDGGNGVVDGGALTLLDSTVAGGNAGANAAGCPPAGSDGVPFQTLGGGSITTIADVLRRFEVSVPIHEGTSAQNTIEGVPGELVVLLVSFAADGAFFPGLGGSLCGTAPFLAVVLGAVPAGGVLSFQVPIAVGSLPAAIDGVNVYEQVLVAGAQGFGLLGTPTVVTVVR